MLKRSYVPPLAVADASVGKKDRSNRDGATLLPQHFCHFLLLPPPHLPVPNGVMLMTEDPHRTEHRQHFVGRKPKTVGNVRGLLKDAGMLMGSQGRGKNGFEL